MSKPILPIPTAFLDRDGTLIEDRHYLHHPDGVHLLPHAVEGCQALMAMGFRLVVVTNQSGIGRGLFTEAEHHAVQARLLTCLQKEGVNLADSFFCPHRPEEGCGCRKPGTGLLEQSAAVQPHDRQYSVMIGDKGSDVACGQAAGMRTIRVLTGAPLGPHDPTADATVTDLLAAADWCQTWMQSGGTR